MENGFNFTPRAFNVLYNGYANHEHTNDCRKWNNEIEKWICTENHKNHELLNIRQLTKFSRNKILLWRGCGSITIKELDDAFKKFGLTYKYEEELKFPHTGFLPLD